MRALKRSATRYDHLITDARANAGPRGQPGTTEQASVTGITPRKPALDKSLVSSQPDGYTVTAACGLFVADHALRDAAPDVVVTANKGTAVEAPGRQFGGIGPSEPRLLAVPVGVKIRTCTARHGEDQLITRWTACRYVNRPVTRH